MPARVREYLTAQDLSCQVLAMVTIHNFVQHGHKRPRRDFPQASHHRYHRHIEWLHRHLFRDAARVTRWIHQICGRSGLATASSQRPFR